ncbi:MAG: DNA circularization N-terminal domain-containing protein [Gluconacetobacter sp.]
MSGSLSTLGLGTVAGSTLSDLGGLGGFAGSALGSILTVAAWRGVTFHMLDVRETTGRRLMRWLYPGRDIRKFQDFGPLDGPIHVVGLIAGDDYVIRAERMRTALRQAGPATLVHPWYGSLRVRLAEPAEIAFSQREIRVAHFSASFFRDPQDSAGKGLFAAITDSLTNVLTKADALVDQGILACRAVLAPLVIPTALASAVSGYLSQLSGVWDGLVASSTQPVQDAAASARATLAAGVLAPASNSDSTYADAVTSALAAVPAALAGATSGTSIQAIAPATQVVGSATLRADPQAVVTTLLSGALQSGDAALALSDVSELPAAVLALGVVARGLVVTQAVATSASVTYVSQVEAGAGRDALLAALDALGTDVQNAAAAGAAVAMAPLWSALRDLRAAVVADYSAAIGRLPAVVGVSIGPQVSAWCVAYAVAGDTPANVLTVMDDLVTRNDLVHPALAGPGTLDLLDLGA